MEWLILSLFLLGPYLLSVALAYWVAGFSYRKIEHYYVGGKTRFFLAISLFVIIEFIVRKIILLLLSLWIGSNPALGVIGFIFGPYLFWITNFLWLGVAVIFALRKSRQFAAIPAPLTPTPDNQPKPRWATPLLILLVVGGLSFAIVPKVLANWYSASEPIGNFLAQTFHAPAFCKIIQKYEGDEKCALAVSGLSNATETNDCGIFDSDTDAYGSCIINRAKTTNNAAECLNLLDYKRYERGECVRGFVGTQPWQQICADLESKKLISDLVSGRCLTSSNVNNLFSEIGERKPAWFLYIWYDNPVTHDLASDVRVWLKSISVNPNTTDEKGKTALISSLQYPSNNLTSSAAKTMIDFGIDVHAKDTSGKRAIDYAVRSGNIDVVNYLLEFLNVSFKPLSEDLNYFLDEDDACWYNEYRKPGEKICIQDNRYNRAESAAHEYITRGWLKETQDGRVFVP